LTAIVVSLCGAVPSQSVFTFAPLPLVVQIGFGGFLNCDSPGCASLSWSSAS
jgi:hypothetical protein